MQNKRQEQLLALLAERRDYMTSRQLAEILQVSDRTIRSDVEAINRRSSPPPIESNVRQGYRLNPRFYRRPLNLMRGSKRASFRRHRGTAAFTSSTSFCSRPAN